MASRPGACSGAGASVPQAEQLGTCAAEARRKISGFPFLLHQPVAGTAVAKVVSSRRRRNEIKPCVARKNPVRLKTMKSSSQWRGRVLRRIAGWSTLLLYLAAFSPLGIGFATALGSLDRDHRVNLLAGDAGLRLVLRHQTACQPHQHGLVARTLTVFARPVSPDQPDHVLQFGAAENFTGSAPIQCLFDSTGSPMPAVTTGMMVSIQSLLPLVSSANHPPPGDASVLRCLRSTVLLI